MNKKDKENIKNISKHVCPNCNFANSLEVDDAPRFNPCNDFAMDWDGEWGIVLVCGYCDTQWSVTLSPTCVCLITDEEDDE